MLAIGVEIFDDVWQTGKIHRVIGPVLLVAHAVDVGPLGVVWNAGCSVALDNLFEPVSRIVLPTTQMKSENQK